ncbi:hypothetical protein DXG01_010909 [Tephrocybe rancida]|nr:hypothetical protein DXG01_010909 [Tephrocybe rancida]
MWKNTWEEELQKNIVEEQQFLTPQEEFLRHLLENHKTILGVYGHIEQVISLRSPHGSSNGLSNVVLEIRGTSIDPEKRMKAIDANQRNRQKKLNARFDDLHAELHDLVGHKKLRITGGAEEVERARQKRSEMTLKAMFNVNVSSPPHSSSDLSFSPLY